MLEEAIEFALKYCEGMTEDEALEAYITFRSYRDEGQSMAVSLQYAGLYRGEQ